MKTPMQLNTMKTVALAALLFLGSRQLMQAQTYETTLTTTNWLENFDELGGVTCSAGLPAGWVMAEGVGLPIYGGPIGASTLTNFTATAPVNFTNYTIINAGGADGSGCTHDVTAPTYGGRINFGDVPTGYGNRSIGYLSSNPSWETPTNDIMFGFYNNMGSNILSLAITNNIKQYRLNTTAAQITFYYSYDGTNWTHVAAGDCGPMATGSSSTYYYNSGPLVSNKSFTISGLNVPNGSPFYIDWHFVIASANGSFSPQLALDDVGLTATLGTPPPAAGNSIWTVGAGGWNTAANWQGSAVPVSGNNLIFKGAGGASTNNLAAVSTGTGTVSSIVFSNAASGSYTLSGNAVTLAGGITNNSAYTQSINLPLTITADQNFVASGGNLAFGSFITNGGNQTIFGGASNITLTGSVTGAGNLVMSGTGTLTLSGASTYTGQTLLNTGTTLLANATAIPVASPVYVGSGTFNMNGYSASLANISGSGSIVTSTNTTLTIVSGGGTGFAGVLSGPGAFTVAAGTGSQELTSASNTISGPITASSGTLAIASTATLGTGPLILAGGTFQLTATRDVTNGILSNAFVLSSNSIIQNNTIATAGNRNLPFGGPVIATNGTLTLQTVTAGNYTNVLILRFYGSVTNFTQPVVFDNSQAFSLVNNTLQLSSWNTNGSAPQMFSGPISGPGTFYRDALTPGTGGTTILTSGASTFTLGTVVVSGYLGIGADSTSSNGVVIAGPLGTGELVIDDSTVNGVAGVGVFAYGGPHVIGNELVLNGVTNTAFTGTNALTFTGTLDVGGIPKTLTMSNTALTSITGIITNTASLTLAGTGALELTADSTTTWSGAMTISGGTLLADNLSGSATGTNNVTVTGGTLAGIGSIAGAVVATTGGSVSPGTNIGILTLQNGLDLSGGGSLVWKLGANSTNNPGTGFSQLALTGGTLNLTGSSVLTLQFTNSATAPNSSVAFWQSSHVWRIVTLSGAAAINGTGFASIVNGTSSAGSFATSVDGSGVLLTFTPGGRSVPRINQVYTQGNQIVFSGTNGTAGAGYYVLTSTNVNVPLSNWVTLTSGNFAANGSFTNSITTNGIDKRRFYLLKLQ